MHVFKVEIRQGSDQVPGGKKVERRKMGKIFMILDDEHSPSFFERTILHSVSVHGADGSAPQPFQHRFPLHPHLPLAANTGKRQRLWHAYGDREQLLFGQQIAQSAHISHRAYGRRKLTWLSFLPTKIRWHLNMCCQTPRTCCSEQGFNVSAS